MRTSISPLSGATSTAVTPAWFRWRGSAPASSSATATYARWEADGQVRRCGRRAPQLL
jgi:hypothetical protein